MYFLFKKYIMEMSNPSLAATAAGALSTLPTPLYSPSTIETNREAMATFNARCEGYQKVAGSILARAPEAAEIGHYFTTYVKVLDRIQEENRLLIKADHIILRKAAALDEAGKYYNEWLITAASFAQTYQIKYAPTTTFASFPAQPKIVTAMHIAQDFLDILNPVAGRQEATIAVPTWGPGQTQKIFLEGYLLCNDIEKNGQFEFYGVTKNDMSSYQKI